MRHFPRPPLPHQSPGLPASAEHFGRIRLQPKPLRQMSRASQMKTRMLQERVAEPHRDDWQDLSQSNRPIKRSVCPAAPHTCARHWLDTRVGRVSEPPTHTSKQRGCCAQAPEETPGLVQLGQERTLDTVSNVLGGQGSGPAGDPGTEWRWGGSCRTLGRPQRNTGSPRRMTGNPAGGTWGEQQPLLNV